MKEKTEQVSKYFVEHNFDQCGDENTIIREVQVAERVTEFQGFALNQFDDAKSEALERKHDELFEIDSKREELAEEIKALENVKSFDEYELLNSHPANGAEND